MGVGSGDGADGFQRRSYRVGEDLVGSVIAPESWRKLPRHRSFLCGVEGSNGDFKFLLCRLHHLP